jgi:hypothetical protein
MICQELIVMKITFQKTELTKSVPMEALIQTKLERIASPRSQSMSRSRKALMFRAQER